MTTAKTNQLKNKNNEVNVLYLTLSTPKSGFYMSETESFGVPQGSLNGF